jgi:hypothetical protein
LRYETRVRHGFGKKSLGPLVKALTELLRANATDDALLDREVFL